MRWMRYLAAVAVVGLVVGCGGGGGSTSSGGGNSGGGTTTPSMAVALVNSSGAAVTSVSVGGAVTVRGTLRDASGAAVPGRLVTFAISDEAIATLSPATALTDASGVAQVTVAPASLSARGAASVTASATVGETAVTGSTDFAVSSSSLALSTLSSSPSSLVSGGNSMLATTATIGGASAAGVPVNVAFSATCGRVNGQVASSGGIGVTTDGNGLATATYSAIDGEGKPCTGAVTLTAASPGATPQSTTVSVAAPVANTVTFVGATPQQIFIRGAGAAEQSVVQFRVLSSAGSALANVSVRFSIDTNPGGVGIGASGSTAPVLATSDQDGLVSVSLFSGSVPGPVKLRAELVGSSPLIFAESQYLTVASGPPSQLFMSFSAVQSSIEGWERDGTSTALTVRLADRQGNSVEDGTVVNFTAEGGQVTRSCTTGRGADGISMCSVSFVTQNPRPADGRVSVLAFATGTKNYVDVNGNNEFDSGVDTLINIGDAYRDDNENGVMDAGEFVIERRGLGTCPAVTDQRFPSRAATCDGSLATTVRQQLVLNFSSSEAAIKDLAKSPTKVSFQLASRYHSWLPMPAGTTVTATSTNTACTARVNGSPVVNVIPSVGRKNSSNPSQPEDLSTAIELLLTGCSSSDTLTVQVTAPSGLTSSFSVALQ